MNQFRTSRLSILPLMCFLTVLSYAKIFPGSLNDIVTYGGWVLVLVEGLLLGKLRINYKAILFVLAGAGLIALTLLLQLITRTNYISAMTIQCVATAIFIFICGSLIGEKITEYDVRVCLRWFTLGMVFLGFIYIARNIATGFNLDTRQYSSGMHGKNSLGLLFATSGLFVMTTYRKEDAQLIKIQKLSIALFLIVLLFLTRSRTSMICFAVAILAFLFSGYANKTAKKIIISLGTVAVLVVIFNPTVQNLVIHKILFANRDATSLDSLSSGRISIYAQFFDLMSGHWLTGNGAVYYESYYLAAFVEFGAIVGTLFIAYVFAMLKSVRKNYKQLEYGIFLLLISISYAVNGIFEAMPPFGPGTKCFVLWMLFGMSFTHIMEKNMDMEERVIE